MSTREEQTICTEYFRVFRIVNSVSNVQNARLGMALSPFFSKMELTFGMNIVKSDHLVEAFTDSKL